MSAEFRHLLQNLHLVQTCIPPKRFRPFACCAAASCNTCGGDKPPEKSAWTTTGSRVFAVAITPKLKSRDAGNKPVLCVYLTSSMNRAAGKRRVTPPHQALKTMSHLNCNLFGGHDERNLRLEYALSRFIHTFFFFFFRLLNFGRYVLGCRVSGEL